MDSREERALKRVTIVEKWWHNKIVREVVEISQTRRIRGKTNGRVAEDEKKGKTGQSNTK
jgi:hypothetical protein